MYIDVHTHGMHAERNKEGKLVPPLVPIWKKGDSMTPIEQCQKMGIAKVALLDPPEVAFALAKDLPDFFIPVPQVDIDKTSPEEINNLFKRGAKGIKFISPMYSYGDNRYFPIYDAIRANDGTAVFHTGYVAIGLFEPGCVLGRTDYVDITNMRPATLDRIGRAFPDLKILMSHFGNPWWEEAWKIISSHKNIYADFSGGTAKGKEMKVWKSLFTFEGKLHTQSIKKICFGTDGAPFIKESTDGIKKMIIFYENFYKILKVPKEIQKLINSENAKMLYKL